MSNFTGVLGEFEQIIGLESTFKIATKWGGSYVVIPKNPKEKNLLVQFIGIENVKKLIKEFGAGEVLIPMGHFRGGGHKRLMIAKLLEKGLSRNEICRMIDVHIKTVERAKKKTFSRLPLFDRLTREEEKKDGNQD